MLKIKKLRDDAVLPLRGSAEAAGMDVYAPHDFEVAPGEIYIFTTGYAFELDRGAVAFVKPRSSCYVMGLDADGTIDSDYRGEIRIGVRNVSNRVIKVLRKERVAQIVVQRHEPAEFILVDHLTPTARGNGGLGSTGK